MFKHRTFLQSLIPFSKYLMVNKDKKVKINNPCKSNPDKECTCEDGLDIEPGQVFSRSVSYSLLNEMEKKYGSADSRMIGSSKYKELKLEPWQEMEMTETKEDFLTYLRLAAKKHQLRLGRKDHTNILEDMQKAEHIIQKWLEIYKKDY